MRELHENTIKEIAKFICGYDNNKYPIYRGTYDISKFLSNFGIKFGTPILNIFTDEIAKSTQIKIDNLEFIFQQLMKSKEIFNIILALTDPRLYVRNKTLQQLSILTMNEILIEEYYKIELFDGSPILIDLKDKQFIKENIMRKDEALIFKLLVQLEGEEKVDLSNSDEETIEYHKLLLIDANYAKGSVIQIGEDKIVRDLKITSKGHDYLDEQRTKGRYHVPPQMFVNKNPETILLKNQKKSLKEAEMENKIKIFISHSSDDVEIMENFVTAITNIFTNLKRSEIVCTSVDGCDIEIGKDIYDFIKDESKNSTITLGMLSRNSIKSETVLFELGIAWGSDKLKPIIIDDGYDFSDLPKPIENKKCLLLFETKGFNKLIDYLEDTLDLLKADTNTIDKFKKDFFDKYPKIKINDKESSINSKPTKDSKINEFEEEWEKDKSQFVDNYRLIQCFYYLYIDAASSSWHNLINYSKYLPFFDSFGLFSEYNYQPKITEKGKYYYKKLIELGLID